MNKRVIISLTALSLVALAYGAHCQVDNREGTLRFSAQPDEAQIFKARVFDEPLVPIGEHPSAGETEALADALAKYSSRTNADDFSSLTAFLTSLPDSSWSPSLRLHLAVEYYSTGHYSKALDSWEYAWQQCKNIEEGPGKAQADRALGELARMYSKLGRMSELQQLLNSTTNRPLTGPGAQLIHAAQQALWMMQMRPEVCFRCGPLALDQILSAEDPKKAGNLLIFQSKSTTNGFSLPQVAALAAELGMNYQMAFRSPGAPFIVPSVIHWKVGHYAALVEKSGERYLVKDHTFQTSLLISAAALDQESSGYLLVPAGSLPPGWRTVSEPEAQAIWGKGNVNSSDSNQTGPTAMQNGGNSCGGSDNSGSPGNGDGTGGNEDSCPPGTTCLGGGTITVHNGDSGDGSGGMTTYTMNTMLASLSLNDTPVGYKPPVGPRVRFTATYNQNNANQPATFSYSNLGPDWTCNWIAYITDDPASPGVGVTCYAPGGGTLTFTGYNSSTKTFTPELYTQGILRMTSSSGYEFQFRSGAKKEFTLSSGASGSSRRIFMTQVVDPAGNSVQLNYDSSFRITNIVDAIGQATVLTYGNASYPDAITQVADPFGRSATFQYNGKGLLTQITDVLGLTSQYTYSTSDFIDTLVTPYGTTSFSSGTTNGATWLQATDPLGETELDEAIPNNTFPTVPTSDPVSTLPVGISEFNGALNYRDTFFWDKKAFQDAAGVYTKATIYHFLHAPDETTESGVLESLQRPLENKLWYNYPGQSANYELGSQSIDRPSAVGRVLTDGTTQLRQYQYNALGNVVNSTDPAGRNFTYVYSTNNVDLLEIKMTSSGKNELQGRMAYNSQHKPITVTDASGQTTTYTYNPRGQIFSITDPLGERTTFFYDTNGYLLSTIGPLQTTNDLTEFTYDAFGRVQTVTDTEGYTLTYTYDVMDRMTNITFPDGTSEQFIYSNLDLVASADRLVRWTTNTYNVDRQLIQTQDPLGRVARFEWCHCGAMTGLIDPMGRKTTWQYDLQSRPIAKTYVDGSTVSYVYENTTSRLSYRVDEQGQETIYTYNIDNTLAGLSYPNAIIPTPSVTYTYDTEYDRLVAMQDGIGLTVYAYNPITAIPALGAGRLASVSGPLPNSTVTYQYDQLGRVATRSINGVAQATTYDILGRPTTVANALGAFQYAYVDATLRIASGAYPNGLTNLYSYYNDAGDQRLLNITHLQTNGNVLSSFGYGYNPVGQIISKTNEVVYPSNFVNSVQTTTENYGYDSSDQLTSVGGTTVTGSLGMSYSYAYAYDFAGNRLVATGPALGETQQFSYNALNHLTAASPGATNGATYEWDAENRLIAIDQGTNRSEFSYDGLGRRLQIVEKTNGVVQSDNYYLWCGTKICEVRDGSGAIVLKRLFPQGEALVGATSSTNYFYTKDRLGSVVAGLNANGLVVAQYSYDPFGQRSVSEQGFQSTFGFTGDFVHQKSGLYLTCFRALDSTSGRWLSRDPLGEKVSQNLYGYAKNNPINHTDFLGLCDNASLNGGGQYSIPGAVDISVNVDTDDNTTFSINGGNGALTFGAYYISNGDYGVSWDPGFKTGLASANFNFTLGTDRLSLGGSAAFGPVNAGYSYKVPQAPFDYTTLNPYDEQAQQADYGGVDPDNPSNF